jgi:hypothetical protein
MEAANEAARRAVNEILDRTGSRKPRCDIFTLPEPAVLRPARVLDQVRWRLGHRPPKPPVRVAGRGDLEPAGLVSRALLGVGSLTRRLGR